MTNIQKAPQHGGLIRVAFDGGSNVRGLLPFSAVAVNIDNWSPYWYKLNPVEEYIPPFQHGVNVSLPLITNYEFVCQAPPGIEQSTIVPTTGIPGNTNPIIAIFSSFATNNDAGFNATNASANISSSFTPYNAITSFIIDLTIYDGFYLDIVATTIQLLIIEDFDPNTGTTVIYNRVMYPNLRLFLTIPKVSRQVRITFTTDPNRVGAVLGSYALRKYIGVLPFSAQVLTKTSGATTPQDFVNTVGETTTNFTTVGLDSVVLTVRPNGGAGVVIGTIYWIKVFASTIGGQPQLLYTKTFIGQETGLGNNSTGNLVLPITGLLNRQIQQLVVFCRPSDGAVTLATAVVQLALMQGDFNGLIEPTYSPPTSYIKRTILAPAAGVWTLITTPPISGMFTGCSVVVSTAGAANSECIFAVGSGATQDVIFGVVPSGIVGWYQLNTFLPLRLDNGFNTFWVFATGAGVTLDTMFNLA